MNDSAILSMLLRPLGALTLGVAGVLLVRALAPEIPGPFLAAVWFAGITFGWRLVQRVSED